MLYNLPWPKSIAAFIIDIIGYIIFGPSIFMRACSFKAKFPPSSILLLRLDHMGDVLMTTPAIIAIKSHFPSARIVVGVREINQNLISLPGIVDRVVSLNVPWVANYSKKSQWTLLLKKIKELRREGFDLAIDFKGDLRNIILLFLTGARLRISYGVRGGGFLLTHMAKFFSEPRHEIDRNLDLVSAIGEDYDRIPRYEVRPEKEAEIKKKLENLFPEKDRLIGIHPGANSLSKAWPSSYFARLADKIEKSGSGRVVIFGGPGEKEALIVIKGCLFSSPLILDNLPIEDLAAFFKELNLFIGNDSGPFHLAEAVGTKVMVIFGSTYPEVVGPVSRDSAVIKSKSGCAPCRKPGEREICKRYECMRDISVDEVYESVHQEMLK